MPLNANKVPSTGPNYEPLESGNYPARLVRLVDFGLQPQRPFKGEEKPPAYEVRYVYELLDEFMKDEDGNEDKEKPRWISETLPLYPLTSDRAKSTKRYKGLDPDNKYDGNWPDLLGTPCEVTIVQNPGKGDNAGKVYENIASVSPMRSKDAEKAPELVNDAIFFDLDAPDLEVFKGFHEKTQEKITSNLEFKGSKLEAALMASGEEPKGSDDTGESVDGDDETPY